MIMIRPDPDIPQIPPRPAPINLAVRIFGVLPIPILSLAVTVTVIVAAISGFAPNCRGGGVRISRTVAERCSVAANPPVAWPKGEVEGTCLWHLGI